MRTTRSPPTSPETIAYHYGKHHRAYVDNLNKMTAGTSGKTESLEDIVRGSEGGLFNNAAQVWNHPFYWSSLSPTGGGEPTGSLADKIAAAFGTFGAFKEEFTKAAIGRFGSGWAWLVNKPESGLAIVTTANAETPLTDDLHPAAHLRRLGARLLHRLPQRPPEVRRAFLGTGELGLRRRQFVDRHLEHTLVSRQGRGTGFGV